LIDLQLQKNKAKIWDWQQELLQEHINFLQVFNQLFFRFQLIMGKLIKKN